MKKYTLFLIVFLVTPLFWYILKDKSLLFISSVFLLFFTLVFKNKGYLNPVLGIVYLILASIFISGIVKFPFNFQIEKTLFADNITDKFVLLSLQRYQEQALYLPFKLRSIIFNNFVFIRLVFSKIFYFFTLENMVKVFFLPNLYPLILGIIQILKVKEKRIKYFVFAGVLTSFLFIGLSRSVDEMLFLAVSAPLFFYILYLGSKNMNKFIYLILLIVGGLWHLI